MTRTQTTPAPHTARADGTVAVLGIGDFGEHVAALLGRTTRRPVRVADCLESAVRNDPAAVVLVMWRPCPGICEQADALAFGQRRPWLPVVMDHPHVRVGPLVVPGTSACFACFQARYAQHDTQRDITAALHAAYDRDPGFGPRGYLDHHARLASALAGVMLGDLGGSPLPEAGQVLTFNPYRGGGIRRHPVVSRPGCSRCSCEAGAGDHSALAGLLRGIAADRTARRGLGRCAAPGEVAGDR